MADLGNSPIAMPGVAAGWPALQLWGGAAGVARLKELCGSASVQVMISREDRFFGDMQHLMLLECSFADFLEGRLDLSRPPEQPQQGQQGQQQAAQGQEAAGGAGAGGGQQLKGRRLHAYLAQCPIGILGFGCKGLQPGPLHALMADLERPAILREAGVNQINFWASPRAACSSLHYDPYSNLLVVVAGAKTVQLVPPDATPALSPQPIYHESANHSPVDLANPDLVRFPELAAVLPSMQTFTLQAGDGLYIPEGWWHQVRSEAGTLAVNFWWESGASQALGGAMDRYFFRRLAQSLLEKEKQRLLASVLPLDLGQLAQALAPPAASPGVGTGKGAGLASGQVGLGVEEVEGAACRSRGAEEAAPLPARLEAAVQALCSLALVASEAAAEAAAGAAAGTAAVGGAQQGLPLLPVAAVAQHAQRHGHHASAAQHAQHVAQHAQQRVEALLAALVAEPQEGLAASDQRGAHSQGAPVEGAVAAAGAADEASSMEEEGAGEGEVGTNGGSSSSGAGRQGGAGLRAVAADSAAAQGGRQLSSNSSSSGGGGSCEALLHVLLALRQRSPASLRWLLLEGLSPVGWELLLSNLERGEEQAAAAHGPQHAHDTFAAFYDQLYSVCQDREGLLSVMLARKEQFAQQALRGVLRSELGVTSARFMEEA